MDSINTGGVSEKKDPSIKNITEEEEEEEEEEEFMDIIASIDPLDLQELALTTRQTLFPNISQDISCTALTSPRMGSFNIVYEVSFSDGVRWAIRLPAKGDVLSPLRARSMHLDIIAQRFICSKTSIPIPTIHHWSLDAQNPLSRPFVITDFIPGSTNLSEVWNDKSWMTQEKREKIFEQLAGWMTELAALEFNEIGRLDFDIISGLHYIAPFPSTSDFFTGLKECPVDADGVPAGPFTSAHAFLSFLLSMRRRKRDWPMLALLQMFVSTLADRALDGPPFAFVHADFDSQNILVDDDGSITGIIDWDNVYIGPRLAGPMTYPSWLTVDWDPIFHGWNEDASPEENARHDSPADLACYRKAYLDAVQRASEGSSLPQITRNSHIWTTLHIAVCNEIATAAIVNHLSKFVFGSGFLGYEVEEGIKRGSWFALGQGKDEIAEVKLIEGFESDDHSDDD